jgi:hypothetical protein
MPKKSDNYLRVIDAAFVTIPDKNTEPLSGRMLLKVAQNENDEIIPLSFDRVEAVDSAIQALYRIREDITKNQIIHPLLRNSVDDGSH